MEKIKRYTLICEYVGEVRSVENTQMMELEDELLHHSTSSIVNLIKTGNDETSLMIVPEKHINILLIYYNLK